MFIEGLHHSDENFSRDAKEISRGALIVMKAYQNERPPQMQAGTVTVHCIYAGMAFALAVLIKDLPRRDRKILREYLITKFDEVLREHGA